MKTTIDRAGRLVIPKPIRVALGITANSELELILDGTGVRLEPTAHSERRVELRDGFPLLTSDHTAVLTDDDVRRLRDDAQR